MATLSEKLSTLDKAQTEQMLTRDTPTSKVYSQRSGTKNVQTKWQIGGKALTTKKVARQPLQIYQGGEFLHNINKNRETVKSKIVNPTRMPKIENKDTRPVMSPIIKKVYGMVLMGGTGVEHAAGYEQKLEATKITKITFLESDI